MPRRLSRDDRSGFKSVSEDDEGMEKRAARIRVRAWFGPPQDAHDGIEGGHLASR